MCIGKISNYPTSCWDIGMKHVELLELLYLFPTTQYCNSCCKISHGHKHKIYLL